jgi:ankyrin repeat protein
MDAGNRRRVRDPPNVIRVEPTSLTKRIRQGDGIDIDSLQKATEKEIMRQDSDGSTPLHALLEISKKLDETSVLDGIQILLSKGAKIGVKDARGRIPLHVATEHCAPASALSLLAQNSSHANALDDNSMTPLHLLFLGDEPVDPDCVRVLLKSGGDLEARDSAHKSGIQPLYLLCERNDASQLLTAIREECPDILVSHKVALLNYAATKGTANALQAVLKEIKDASNDTKLLDYLLMEAAASERQPRQKADILVSHGADLNRLPSLGGCTVFHVAANRGLPVLIQMALQRGMKSHIVDEDGNTPIHYAAECGTGGAECIQLLADSGGDVNARNKSGRTPIFSAVASENLAAAAELIRCGSHLPSLSIARKYGPKQLRILADIKVVESAYDPLQTALRIGGFFKKCAKVNIGYNDQYNQWAAAMETVAMEMLDCNESDGMSELLSYPIIYCAVENRQKQFIAHAVVQNHLLRVWNGPRQHHGLRFFRYYFTLLLYHIAKIIVYPGLLLFYYLPLYRRHARFYAGHFLYSTPPSVRYGVAAICNIGFAVTLFIESVQGAGVRTMAQLDSIEIIILIYTIGYILHETQDITRQSTKVYFSSWTNIIDIAVLLMFTVYFILRFIDMASEGLEQSDSELQTNRARELIIALATLIVFLRVLDYLKAFPGVGPIQASFGQITHDTFSFLIILVVFGLAFATTISEVYSAGRFSPEYQKVLEECRDNFLENERNKSARPSGLPPPTVVADYGDGYVYDYVFACVEKQHREGKAPRSVPEAVDG